MKVKINHNNDALYCLYWKDKIEIGERYIEVVEEYLGDEITKTYSYGCLDMLVTEYLENYNIEPEIIDE